MFLVTPLPIREHANEEGISLFTKTLRVSKSRIEIVIGHNARNKLIPVETLTEPAVHNRIKIELSES